MKMMRHWLLLYTTEPDYLERRQEFREDHLRLASAAADRGELLLGGAVGDPVEGAALLFIGEGREAAETFAAADPYVKAGPVSSWKVREWRTVVGPGCLHPVAAKR
jgi:hypothetical protein